MGEHVLRQAPERLDEPLDLEIGRLDGRGASVFERDHDVLAGGGDGRLDDGHGEVLDEAGAWAEGELADEGED